LVACGWHSESDAAAAAAQAGADAHRRAVLGEPPQSTLAEFVQFCGSQIARESGGPTLAQATAQSEQLNGRQGSCTDGKRWVTWNGGFTWGVSYYSADGSKLVGSVGGSDVVYEPCDGIHVASIAPDYRTLLCDVATWSGGGTAKPRLPLADGARLGLDPNNLPPEAPASPPKPRQPPDDPTRCEGRQLRCKGTSLQLCVESSWVVAEDCGKPELCSMVGPRVGCIVR
jgi:hypothetical protein